jgi:hypothetical protein
MDVCTLYLYPVVKSRRDGETGEKGCRVYSDEGITLVELEMSLQIVLNSIEAIVISLNCFICLHVSPPRVPFATFLNRDRHFYLDSLDEKENTSHRLYRCCCCRHKRHINDVISTRLYFYIIFLLYGVE